MTSNIIGIGTATPAHRMTQKEILRFMVKAHGLGEIEARRLEVLYRASGINSRYSVLSDYGKQTEDFTFYPQNDLLQPFPGVSQRMLKFKQEALPLCLAAINELSVSASLQARWVESITHLITVSCTGMYAPGLDIDLMEHLKLNSSVQRTAINFMGCHAAINALKIGDTICRADENAVVLIVCVELCTLHFQNQPTEDNLLANALFSDGCATVVMKSRPEGAVSLRPENFLSEVEYAGRDDMAWQIGDSGFEMKLSSYVPDIIRNGIRGLTKKLLQHHRLGSESIDFFAIHPGGKKILEAIEQALEIDRKSNWASYETLKSFGNMSSPTVLFVLKLLMKQLKTKDHGKKILSFAFGPGLTMESMLLTVNSKN